MSKCVRKETKIDTLITSASPKRFTSSPGRKRETGAWIRAYERRRKESVTSSNVPGTPQTFGVTAERFPSGAGVRTIFFPAAARDNLAMFCEHISQMQKVC